MDGASIQGDGCQEDMARHKAFQCSTFLPIPRPAIGFPSEAERLMRWRPVCSPGLASTNLTRPSVLEAFFIAREPVARMLCILDQMPYVSPCRFVVSLSLSQNRRLQDGVQRLAAPVAALLVLPECATAIRCCWIQDSEVLLDPGTERQALLKALDLRLG